MKTVKNQTSRRFVGLGSNPRARFRLFCFPFAGGAGSAYRLWRSEQGTDLEVVAVELPGREKRATEPPLRHVSALVEDALVEWPLDVPFALFGHSMGGLLSFELARALAARSLPGPVHLFASAFRAPHLPQRTRLKHLLPDAELVEEMKRLDGTPPELLENPELVEMVLRLFRADLTVVETYPYTEQPPLGCPITAFGGVDDEDVLRDELEEWEAHTSSRFRLQMMAGHHFYLYEARQQLLQAIRRDLSLVAQRWSAHV